jgi:hypothetical protein
MLEIRQENCSDEYHSVDSWNPGTIERLLYDHMYLCNAKIILPELLTPFSDQILSKTEEKE